MKSVMCLINKRLTQHCFIFVSCNIDLKCLIVMGFLTYSLLFISVPNKDEKAGELTGKHEDRWWTKPVLMLSRACIVQFSIKRYDR